MEKNASAVDLGEPRGEAVPDADDEVHRASLGARDRRDGKRMRAEEIGRPDREPTEVVLAWRPAESRWHFDEQRRLVEGNDGRLVLESGTKDGE